MTREGDQVDKQMRRKIIYRIGDINEQHCDSCEYRDDSQHCKNKCKYGKELLHLGALLEGKMEPKIEEEVKEMELTVDVYKELKAKGLSDKEIMQESGIDHNKLHKFKTANGLKSKRNTSVKTSNNKDQAEKITSLQNQIRELVATNQKLVEENGNLNAVCENLENEVDQLKTDLSAKEKELKHLAEQPKFTFTEEHLIALENVLKFYIMKSPAAMKY